MIILEQCSARQQERLVSTSEDLEAEAKECPAENRTPRPLYTTLHRKPAATPHGQVDMAIWDDGSYSSFNCFQSCWFRPADSGRPAAKRRA